jgi:hypothetical protein
MSIRAFILASSFLITAPLLARDKTDVMVMKNGDRIDLRDQRARRRGVIR